MKAEGKPDALIDFKPAAVVDGDDDEPTKLESVKIEMESDDKLIEDQ